MEARFAVSVLFFQVWCLAIKLPRDSVPVIDLCALPLEDWFLQGSFIGSPIDTRTPITGLRCWDCYEK